MAGNKWKARRVEVEALLAEGRSQADIARYFRVSPARFNSVLKQYRADDAKAIAAMGAKEAADRFRLAADILDPAKI